jgi:pilus assembly protein CpaB
MPIRTIATIAIAVLLGVVAVVLAQSWLGRQRVADQETAVLAGTTPVLVATQPLARGIALQEGVVRVVRFPQESVPPGALTSLDQVAAGDRLVLRPIAANEPILSDKITVPGGGLNLSASMTPGMRAVTFRSNDVTGVGGFVLPGDRVDVLLTRNAGDGTEDTIAQILADNIKVLAVDQLADESADQPTVSTSITIEVTPQQAQLIRLSESVGTVSLSLRQVSDELPIGGRIVTINDLGGMFLKSPEGGDAAPADEGAQQQVASAEPAALPIIGPVVRVTRGVDTSTYDLGR